MFVEKIIKWGIVNPKKVFLADAFGAMISAFLLGFVLVELYYYFGIPVAVLYFLAVLPCLFAMFDFYCFFSSIKNFDVFLKAIAIMNTAFYR